MFCSSPRWFAISLLAACTFVCACPAEFPGPEPFSAQEIAGRTEIARTPGRTQSELRQVLGFPWITSDRWHVDVFRLSGRQRVWVGVPVPLPDTRQWIAFTLVTYDETGRVEAADSALLEGGWGPIALEAGDYQLVTGWPIPLSVTLNRFLADQAARAPAGECTLLVACDPGRPGLTSFQDYAAQREAGETSPSVCWSQLSIDGGSKGRLPIQSIVTFDRHVHGRMNSSMSGPREDALLMERGDVTCIDEDCHVQHHFFVPLPLSVGEHSLRFSAAKSLDYPGRAPLYDGWRLKGAELDAKVICEDGETVFATLSKERTQGRIEITREPPSQLPRHTVLLFYGHRVGRRSLDGEWLLPTDSPAR